MLAKLLTLVVSISIFSVQAHAVSNNSLKSVFDELNYSLTVEWDQEDKDFYKDSTKKFQAAVKKLQTAGMTNVELIEFAKSQIKDKKVAFEFETALSLVSLNMLSKKEARELIISTLSKSYNQGASWSGDAAIIYAVVILAVVVAAVVAGSSVVVVDDGGYGSSCYDEYNCYDYYDSWYGYWYTDCYWETYCY